VESASVVVIVPDVDVVVDDDGDDHFGWNDVPTLNMNDESIMQND
jgi:hypothetical protein